VKIKCKLSPQKPRNHKLGSIADGIHGAILHNNALVARKENLERRDDPPQVSLVWKERSVKMVDAMPQLLMGQKRADAPLQADSQKVIL
jgi:hypothetical protein